MFSQPGELCANSARASKGPGGISHTRHRAERPVRIGADTLLLHTLPGAPFGINAGIGAHANRRPVKLEVANVAINSAATATVRISDAPSEVGREFSARSHYYADLAGSDFSAEKKDRRRQCLAEESERGNLRWRRQPEQSGGGGRGEIFPVSEE